MKAEMELLVKMIIQNLHYCFDLFITCYYDASDKKQQDKYRINCF